MKSSKVLVSCVAITSILSSCYSSSENLQTISENNNVFVNRVSNTNPEIEPHLGEKLFPNEAQITKDIENSIIGTLRKEYTKPPVKRDVHAKHHGCVKAFFNVQNNKIPSEFKVGVLSQNKTYPTWIRFSNGSKDASAPDIKGDVRGMAIKLMGVPGRKLLASEANEQTQDFLLMNNSNFFIDDLNDYHSFTKAMAKGGLGFAGFMATHPRTAIILAKIAGKKVGNPAEIDYFSATPYKLGDSAVKYRMKPCSNKNTPIPSNPSNNYLQDALVNSLDKSDMCYDFMVQFRKGSLKDMSVEESMKEWSEQESPFIPVARVTIPRQDFNSDKQMNFCENLSFTPWHTLPEHRPLGAANRVRKTVYEAVSKYRHQQNEAPRREPKDHNIF